MIPVTPKAIKSVINPAENRKGLGVNVPVPNGSEANKDKTKITAAITPTTGKKTVSKLEIRPNFLPDSSGIPSTLKCYLWRFRDKLFDSIKIKTLTFRCRCLVFRGFSYLSCCIPRLAMMIYGLKDENGVDVLHSNR